MSLLSLRSKSAREKGDRFLENTSLGRLAKVAFRQPTPPQFSRKEPRQPLLLATPDSEKETVIRIWRVILRFTGDMTDYKQAMKTSMQPALGSVMSRLFKELGMSLDEYPRSSGSSGDPGTASSGSRSPEDGKELKTLPNKPKGGTLKRLRHTLTERLFRQKTQTIFHSLPLENTLMTSLDHVHFIVGYGILKPQIRDEIYCQICKLIINNPYKTGVARCWVLLALVLGSFPPSPEISTAVTGFIKEGPPMYSTPLKKLLQDSLRNGSSRYQPPSYLELQAYQEHTPIELQVTLMDGTVHTVVADGTSTARHICHRVCNSLGLRKNFGYSLFISMFGKVASLGSGADRVMDAISQCEQIFREQDGGDGNTPWRLFYRKEMFSPWEDTSGDLMAISVTYAQIIRGVLIGEYVCEPDQDLAILVARQYYIEYGDEISEQGLHDILPSYIPPSSRKTEDSIKTWRKLVMKAHNKLFPTNSRQPSIDRVKLDVVQYAKVTWPMAFSRYYDVAGLEGPISKEEKVERVAVNSSGMYFMSANKRIVLEVSFPEVLLISGESTSPDGKSDIVMLMLADGSILKFDSLDAAAIRDIVGDIMSGLRTRSVWALVRNDGPESSTDHVAQTEGDLIELNAPLVENMADQVLCSGVNVRTAEKCLLPVSALYIVPVLTQPSEAILKLFRTTRHSGCSFNIYMDDCALPRNSSQDVTPAEYAPEVVFTGNSNTWRNSNQDLQMTAIAEINEADPDHEKENITGNPTSGKLQVNGFDDSDDDVSINVSGRSVHFTDRSPEVFPPSDVTTEMDQSESVVKVKGFKDDTKNPLKYTNYHVALHDTVTAL